MYFAYPLPQNEPVLNYTPGSKERDLQQKTLQLLKKQKADIPMYIGGKEIRTGNKKELRPPHEIAHVLGHFHEGDESHVRMAIDAALAARDAWAALPWKTGLPSFLRLPI